jgi:hypothetical protein
LYNAGACEVDEPEEELKPLRPHHRGDQIDEGQGGDNTSDIDHDVLLNFFAGEYKREADSDPSQAERKSKRQPDSDIHCMPSIKACSVERLTWASH